MSELVVVEKHDLMTVFTATDGLDPVLAKIASEARLIIADASTAKGRETIRSMAYKVAQSKVYLDGLGKDLVSEMKELPKKVDEHRKMAREFLEALQAEVRKPLTDYEAEQARIEAEKKAKAEVEALAVKVENDHEIGLLLNAEFDRQEQAKKDAEVIAAKARDDKIAQEAAERATREAAALAEKEKAEALAREVALRVQAERAEQDRLAAIEKGKQDALLAEQAKEAAARKAAQDALDAVENERKRVAAQQAQEDAERTKREADKQHKARINSAAVAALVKHAGVTEDQAKLVVIAICKGLVPETKITY